MDYPNRFQRMLEIRQIEEMISMDNNNDLDFKYQADEELEQHESGVDWSNDMGEE